VLFLEFDSLDELLLLLEELLLLDDWLLLLVELLLVELLLLLVEDVLFSDFLLASWAAASFFSLQEASYCFPFFLNEATLMVTPLSSTPKATAASTWHLPLSLDLAGFWA
jgi:hypothetical protein